MLLIRPATASDGVAIRRVHETAFGRPAEADAVERLLDSGLPSVSLVADLLGRVVGHALFMPATVAWDHVGVAAPAHPWRALRAACLWPLAVRPIYQGRGVGAELVRGGLRAGAAAHLDLVFTTTLPGFWSQFGFRPAWRHGLRCPPEVSREAFLVREMRLNALDGTRGQVAPVRHTFAA